MSLTSGVLDLLVIRMLFFITGFLSDSFLLCKTFRSIKGGIMCCSFCTITCVTYSFFFNLCADCLCNWISLERMLALVFLFAICWYSLWICWIWRIYVDPGWVCMLKIGDENNVYLCPCIYYVKLNPYFISFWFFILISL